MIEVILILVLLVFNGVFAMTEIALVSARKARLRQLADEGSVGARQALVLLGNPERFLSSVQIGITLVGVLSGAFGGAALSGHIQPWIAAIPWLEPHSAPIAFALVVVAITYLSLVVGELAPKGIALRHPEAIASTMSRPMALLAKLASPLVWILELSTRLLMRSFGGSGNLPSGPTREEVRVLVREGIITGMVDADEYDMVEGVFDLRKVLAEEIMRPKPKVLFLLLADTPEHFWPRVAASRQTVFPVHEGSHDEICGLVSLRDLFANSASGNCKSLAELITPPIFVSENQPALSLMQTLRASPLGAALVTDEFGTIRGLITLEDLVEEIVGELRPGTDPTQSASFRPSGENCWIIDGLMEIDDVIEHLPALKEVVEREHEPFQTLAGYIVHRLDRLPAEGESFREGDFEFEVIDMDRQRIDKVLIRSIQPSEGGQAEDSAGPLPGE
ncbi:HlyC/CorC family transporter [Akkermansiaceae bacterium]|nr:HlyC/CorC family transporter [Akkermansiaceae bacterium]